MTSLPDRLERWAEERPQRVAGRNPWAVAVRVVKQCVDDRVGGLAAEMAFFALLSLLPLLVAAGAALGYLELLIGAEAVDAVVDQALVGARTVFGEPFTSEQIEPLVVGLLTQERGGTALSGLVVAVYLSSRVFVATIRALDEAYDLEERRNLLQQRLLALAFAVGALIVVPLTLAGLVIGPLLGEGRQLAARFGVSEVYAWLWSVGRWPVLFALVVLYFAVLYRFGPNARLGWRHSLPGALLGVVLWIAASIGFRLYLGVGGGAAGSLPDDASEAVAQIGGVIGAVVAGIVWVYLTSLAVLIGGELNAVLAVDAADDGERRAPAE